MFQSKPRLFHRKLFGSENFNESLHDDRTMLKSLTIKMLPDQPVLISQTLKNKPCSSLRWFWQTLLKRPLMMIHRVPNNPSVCDHLRLHLRHNSSSIRKRTVRDHVVFVVDGRLKCRNGDKLDQINAFWPSLLKEWMPQTSLSCSTESLTWVCRVANGCRSYHGQRCACIVLNPHC